MNKDRLYLDNYPDGEYEFPHSWGAITLPDLIYFKYVQKVQSIKILDNHACLLYTNGKSEYLTLDRFAQRVYKYV